jgi:hypothetical protein
VFGNSTLGPQIAEARRRDDFVRAAAYRTSISYHRGEETTSAPRAGGPFTPATDESIRYRIGAVIVSFGHRLSGVELQSRAASRNDHASAAIPGVR